MSTPANEAAPRKRYAAAQIEAALAAAPQLTATLSCQDLCDEIHDDMDTLEHLEDFPPHSRGRIRMAMLRAISTLNHQMKQRHCPDCPA